VMQGSASILDGATYVGRTIFPTSVLPVVAVSSGLVNFLLSLPLLGILLLLYDVPFGPEWMYLPLLLFIQTVLLIGLTSLLSALSVFFRDIQHMLGHILTLLFFSMPIMYPMTTIPEKYRPLVALNPLATLFHSYQQIFYFHQTPDLRALAYVLAGSIALYALGQFVFNRNSESFAEYL
jgi:lipopolysaccharide transport system permease protein